MAVHSSTFVFIPSEVIVRLPEILAELGLNPLDPECKEEIELMFAHAVTQWRSENEPMPRHCTFEHEYIVRRFAALTESLETVEYALNVATDAAYLFNYEVINHLQEDLARDLAIGSTEAAGDILADLGAKARIVARSSRNIERKLSPVASKSGRRKYVWYDHFAMAVMLMCERNGIKPTISTNRTNWERGGRFIEIAERLEQVLPTGMRSPNRQALAQRLKRSRARIRPQYQSRKTKAAERAAPSASRFLF
jgi:hypothetical protein